MNTLLIVFAVILTIIWTVGLFVLSLGAFMHLAMVGALFIIMLRILRSQNPAQH